MGGVGSEDTGRFVNAGGRSGGIKQNNRLPGCLLRAVSVLSRDPAPAMVRVVLAPHPLLLVTVVVAVCAAIPHAVMAIDLSRLYGHISSKRSGKTTTHPPVILIHPLRSINTPHLQHLYNCTTKYIKIDFVPLPLRVWSFYREHLWHT